ncbi:MAG: tetratricopeptide repeat protein [candidate division Zixibacteria bacterium]|nr:tetratricopeptide repeat protein [candidate division Zixibacteria bacterium]
MSETPALPRGYTARRRLGVGGTAAVYLVDCDGCPTPLALKLPLENESDRESFRRLIARERQMIGRRRFPGLVRLPKMLHATDANALALEYCPGDTLDKIGRIDDRAVLMNLLSAVAIDLYYLKLAGIAHGDLKPQNIFLTAPVAEYADAAARHVKISDFSLAKFDFEPPSTRLGLGTMGYIAPETIDENRLDHRSDLFALGIMAYQLAVGIHPFMENETDPVRINARIKEHDPTPPIQLRPDLPAPLSELIMSLLAKSPEHRPKDAFVVCQRLHQCGTTYPYERIIRPKYIIELNSTSPAAELFKSNCYSLETDAIQTLLDFAGEDGNRQRLVQEINFRRGALYWHNGRISRRTDSALHWPSRLMHWEEEAFRRLTMPYKRAAVRTAVLGEIKTALQLGIVTREAREYLTRPLLTGIRRRLSPATVRRQAHRLADLAIQANQILLAARLYIKAGDLENGFTVALDAVAELTNKNEYAVAEELLAQLESLCRQCDDPDLLRLIFRHQAGLAKHAGEAARAEKIYLKIIELYADRDRDRLLAEVYKELGDIYHIKQDYAAGIEALQQAEAIFMQIGDRLELSHTLNNLGNLYWVNSEYHRAFNCYRQALHIQRQLNACDDVASSLGNIASTYLFQERFERSIKLYNLSLQLNREIGNGAQTARILNNLGYVHNELGQFDKSVLFLSESRELNHRIGNKKELLFNLENLTRVMLSAGKLRDSISHLKEGMHLSREVNDRPHEGIFLRGMGKVFMWMGFYGQAYDSLQKAETINRELHDDWDLMETMLYLAELQYRLNHREGVRDICKQVADLAVKLNNRRTQLHAAIILARSESDIAKIETAQKIAEDVKVRRDLDLVTLARLEILLKNRQYQKAAQYLEPLSRVFREGRSDIANARFFNLQGDYLYASGDLDRARQSYESAHRHAKISSLLPDIVAALRNLGMMYSDQGDYEAAYACFRNAIVSVKKIAEDISDAALKTRYLQDTSIAVVAAEIKRLNHILAGNK